jgi:hypothetical protein
LCSLLVICHVQLDHHPSKPQTLLTGCLSSLLHAQSSTGCAASDNLIGCSDVLLLTKLGRGKHQGTPTWKRHGHVNRTVYYSLETQDPRQVFRRIITADVTDPDTQTAIDECGDEYHEWLEEVDLEDLPYDLELPVHFDNAYRREMIGSFMSYQKQVKFTSCPRDNSDPESVYASSSSVSHLMSYWFLISFFYTRYY